MFSMLLVAKQSKVDKPCCQSPEAGSDGGCSLAQASAVLSTCTLTFCVKARGNYVGRWNEQIGVGGGRTYVWDKGAGKCKKMRCFSEESS